MTDETRLNPDEGSPTERAVIDLAKAVRGVLSLMGDYTREEIDAIEAECDSIMEELYHG